MAPEQGGESKNFSVAVDIWSLGIVFCQLLTHKDEQYVSLFLHADKKSFSTLLHLLVSQTHMH
jgi:serine/threonine protein kinase